MRSEAGARPQRLLPVRTDTLDASRLGQPTCPRALTNCGGEPSAGTNQRPVGVPGLQNIRFLVAIFASRLQVS